MTVRFIAGTEPEPPRTLRVSSAAGERPEAPWSSPFIGPFVFRRGQERVESWAPDPGVPFTAASLLPPGVHDLTITAEGFEPVTCRALIRAGEVTGLGEVVLAPTTK
jgi:hypothetical protein